VVGVAAEAGVAVVLGAEAEAGMTAGCVVVAESVHKQEQVVEHIAVHVVVVGLDYHIGELNGQAKKKKTTQKKEKWIRVHDDWCQGGWGEALVRLVVCKAGRECERERVDSSGGEGQKKKQTMAILHTTILLLLRLRHWTSTKLLLLRLLRLCRLSITRSPIIRISTHGLDLNGEKKERLLGRDGDKRYFHKNAMKSTVIKMCR
jgi:hypothetical protein